MVKKTITNNQFCIISLSKKKKIVSLVSIYFKKKIYH